MALALPITLMQIYDRILANKAVSTLIWLIVGCVSAMVLESIVKIVRSNVGAWMSARFEHQVSLGAIDKINASASSHKLLTYCKNGISLVNGKSTKEIEVTTK